MGTPVIQHKRSPESVQMVLVVTLMVLEKRESNTLNTARVPRHTVINLGT
jgi:hypothetical protein